MLNTASLSTRTGLGATALLLLSSLVTGSWMGHQAPVMGAAIGQYTDPVLLSLIILLFSSVRFDALSNLKHKLSFLSISLVANFLIVPLIGYGIASLILPDHPLIMVGLIMYFMSPCTDWFLGFTRICQGDTLLGSALLPINMVVQLLLYPIYLSVFTQNNVSLASDVIVTTFTQWFLTPLLVAVIVHLLIRTTLPQSKRIQLFDGINRLIPIVISIVIFQIFASNFGIIIENVNVFIRLLADVFCFFVLTFALSEILSRFFKLPYQEHVLLTMTIAARNAPLMLAVTMVALPSQPLIYAAIVIGMLLEFPHLTLISHLLLRSKATHQHKHRLHDSEQAN